MLITELDRSGSLDKAKFAEQLRDSINEAELRRPERYDLMIAEALADYLSDPGKPRWTPTVLPGGKDEH